MTVVWNFGGFTVLSVELVKLHFSRLTVPHALDRTRIGRQIEETLAQIAQVQEKIFAPRAESLAAVKRRRLADDPIEVARRLRDAHGLTAVTTLGSAVAVALAPGEFRRVVVLPVTPVETTGAGPLPGDQVRRPEKASLALNVE